MFPWLSTYVYDNTLNHLRPAPKPHKSSPLLTRRDSPPATQSFEAMQKLRKANEAVEVEDGQRMKLKDTVDACSRGAGGRN